MILSYYSNQVTKIIMTTLSIPLPSELTDFISSMVASNKYDSKAGVVRHAVSRLAQEEAYERLVLAERDIADGKGIKGNLRELVDKI